MAHSFPNIPAKNYIHISQPENSIQGTWLLDTTIKLPRRISTHAADGSVRPHLKLEAHKGSVTSEVFVAGRDWNHALMEVSTNKGSITLRLTRPARQRIQLVIRSNTGNVTLYVPPDLFGHITYTGTAAFSPRAETLFSEFYRMELTTNGQSRKKHRLIHPTTPEPYDGDHIDIDTNGKIRFCVYGEDEDDGSRSVRTYASTGLRRSLGSSWRQMFSSRRNSTLML